MDKSVYGTSKSDVGFRRTWGNAKDSNDQLQEQQEVKGPRRDADGKLELSLAGPRQGVELEEHVNTVRVLDGLGSGGFACEACSLSFPDSGTYLAHLNSRKHQLALGQSMRVERSSADQVRARIAYWKKKLSEAPEGIPCPCLIISKYSHIGAIDMDSRLEKREQEILARKAQRLEKREEKKRRKLATIAKDGEEDVSEEAQAMAALMGFSSFGSLS
jgi:U4/U6.U5 tri-snRNP component SNU23